MHISTRATDDYAEYTGKPIDRKTHTLALIPQSVADGWNGFCSCGRWLAFANFYDHPDKESLLGAIRHAFDEHVAGPGGE